MLCCVVVLLKKEIYESCLKEWAGLQRKGKGRENIPLRSLLQRAVRKTSRCSENHGVDPLTRTTGSLVGTTEMVARKAKLEPDEEGL